MQKVGLASAVLGTCGLIWSLVGYSRRTAALVLILLLVGVVGVLAGLYGAINASARAADNNNLGSPGAISLRLLAMSWLLLGPAIVGLVQARRAVQVLRAVA
jgi:hypothetical protein